MFPNSKRSRKEVSLFFISPVEKDQDILILGCAFAESFIRAKSFILLVVAIQTPSLTYRMEGSYHDAP